MLALGHRWYTHPALEAYPFQAGVEFFDRNTDDFLLSLGYRHDRQHHCYQALEENRRRIAVFAHEGVGCAFLSSLLGVPYSLLAAHYAMTHTGVTAIYFDSTGDAIVPRLLYFSSDAHIYKEGLPTKYNGELYV